MAEFRVRLESRYLPAQAFINCWPDERFFAVLENFAKRLGGGCEDASCDFSGGPESEEGLAPGVHFWLLGEHCVLTIPEFLAVVRAAIAEQAQRGPQDAPRLAELASRLERSLVGA